MNQYVNEVRCIETAWRSGVATADDSVERLLDVISRREQTLWNEMRKNMMEATEIEYQGTVYERITGCFVRGVRGRHSGLYREKIFVELADKCRHAVVIAPAEKIKVLRG